MPPKLSAQQETVEVYVGKSLQMQCFNVFKPEPERIWTKLAGQMPEESRIQFQYSKSVMMISGAKLSDSGNYNCKAKNDAGESSIVIKAIIYGNKCFCCCYMLKYFSSFLPILQKFNYVSFDSEIWMSFGMLLD